MVAGTTLTDTVTGTPAIVLAFPITIVKIEYDANGNPYETSEILTEGVSPLADYTLTPVPGPPPGFTIEFLKDFDYPVKIKYSGSIPNSSVIDGEVTYTNHVQENGVGSGGTSTGTAKPQQVVKRVKEYNPTDKTVTWEVDVNLNRYTMTALKVTDVLSKGLTLDSLAINELNPGGVSGNKVNLVANANDKGYQQTISGGGSLPTTIDIAFTGPTTPAGDYYETNESFRLTIVTSYPDDLSTATVPFTNDVTVLWTDGSGPHNSTDKATVDPNDYDKDDGAKSGSYNPLTKEITWTVQVNYSEAELQDAYIWDTIQAGQVFVGNSVRIFDYTIGSGPGGLPQKGAEITDLSNFIIREPRSDGILRIDLPDDSGTPGSKYWIEYRTTLDGQLVLEKYSNTAIYHNKFRPPSYLDATVDVVNGGTYIAKSGQQDADGFVRWSLTVNPSQSTIYDAVVTDTPSTNQVVDVDSLIVYTTRVGADGTLIPNNRRSLLKDSDYTVTYAPASGTTSPNILTITFIGDYNPMHRALIIEYRTRLYLEPNDTTVTNHAKLTGSNNQVITDEGDGSVTLNITNGSGVIVGKKGSITLQKVNGHNLNQPLAGAQLEIFDVNWNSVGPPLTTDAEGKIKIDLLYGQYWVVETVPPPGYSISAELSAGVEVTVNAKTTAEILVPQLLNEPSAVRLTKRSEGGTLLPGATFTLEKKTGSNWTPALSGRTFTTDAQGMLTVDGLARGHYRFVETAASPGYILNTQPIEFELATNADGITVAEVEFINYLGSVEFTKVDLEDNTLADVEFELHRINANNDLLGTYTTDANGVVRVENLAPGRYYFQETKPREGFVLDSKLFTFYIAPSAPGKPPVVDLGGFPNNRYFGDVQIYKTDDASRPLAGAEFKVSDLFGNVIQKGIVTDSSGRLHIEKLVPGTYEVIETKAPDGYVLDKSVHYVMVRYNINGANTTTVLNIVNIPDPNPNSSSSVPASGADAGGGGVPTGDSASPIAGFAVLLSTAGILAGLLILRRRKKTMD